jgi:hypothetical protein
MFPASLRSWGRSAAALLALSALAPGQTPPPAPAPIPVGINLRPITAYDRSWAFADVMKMSTEWVYEDATTKPHTKPLKGGTPVASDDVLLLDREGWPLPAHGRAVFCEFFVGMRGRIPAGEYVCTWKGKGKLEFRGHVGILSQGPGRLVAKVDGVNGGQPGIRISGVDLGDPIRDIHVWMPGLEASCHYFHPIFLERMQPFSVVRFYPWMKVYSSSGRWGKRSTLATARQGNPEGVALEYMVELCNELRSDPWFCIPHTADDEYVRRFATLVRDSLHHGARVYVEFSNETWNTDFVAGKHYRDLARSRGVPAMEVVAERAAQVFDIWHEVFGREAGRVVRVAGVQLHNPGIATALCRALEGEFDALAVGAYFGARADRDDVDATSTADQLLAAASANLDAVVLPRIVEHKNLADTYSIELGRHIALLTYEGGQSIVARSPGGGLGVDATLACQERPEMFDLYRRLIDGSQARGVELFVGYDFCGPRSSSDTYSVLEHIQQPLTGAAKYRALIQGWESRGQ